VKPRPRSIFLALASVCAVVQHVELGLRLEILRVIRGARLLMLAQRRFQLGQISGAARGDLQRGLVADGLALLRQEASGHVFVPLHGAGIGLVLLEDQREQGGLPAPLGPTRATRSA